MKKIEKNTDKIACLITNMGVHDSSFSHNIHQTHHTQPQEYSVMLCFIWVNK